MFLFLSHTVCVCVCECKEPTSFQFPEKEQKILLINPPLVFLKNAHTKSWPNNRKQNSLLRLLFFFVFVLLLKIKYSTYLLVLDDSCRFMGSKDCSIIRLITKEFLSFSVL